MTFIIGTPFSRGGGYFLNNKELKQSQRQEADIRTCPHCQAIIKLQEWKINGGWCGKCQAPLCNNPTCVAETAKYGCVPFFKKFERHLEHQALIEKFIKSEGQESPVPPKIIVTG